MCSTIFIHTLFFFLVDSFSILLYFWKDFCLFIVSNVWELNGLILLIQLFWRIILLFPYKRSWWISRTLLLEWDFDLRLWNNLGLCNLFTVFRIINYSSYSSNTLTEFLNCYYFIKTSKVLLWTKTIFHEISLLSKNFL